MTNTRRKYLGILQDYEKVKRTEDAVLVWKEGLSNRVRDTLLEIYEKEIRTGKDRVWGGSPPQDNVTAGSLGFTIKDDEGDEIGHISRFGLHAGDSYIPFKEQNLTLMVETLTVAVALRTGEGKKTPPPKEKKAKRA